MIDQNGEKHPRWRPMGKSVEHFWRYAQVAEGANRRLIDALARTWRGQPVTEDEDSTFPNWLITAENLPDERPLPAVKDYKAQFEALWGLTESE